MGVELPTRKRIMHAPQHVGKRGGASVKASRHIVDPATLQTEFPKDGNNITLRMVITKLGDLITKEEDMEDKESITTKVTEETLRQCGKKSKWHRV
ncbi:hypothetical protein C5167_047912 [Papaver somniferum]|uniref:Uncharacterized protein n=1 Tax=Papaver somniferum TaxID=3469 RepID=A0A4Y7KHU8_PAPSO|nr:hypothetical protein C5167_047912 [Papaver somniferum]